MNPIESFNSYFKVDEEAQDGALKRKRQLILWGISSLLVALIICIAVPLSVANNKRSHSHNSTPRSSNPDLTPAASLKSLCSVTPYPVSCISSISKISTSNTTTDPETLFKLSLSVVVDELASISVLPKTLADETDDEVINSALDVCREVFENAIDSLDRTVLAMEVDKFLNSTKINNLQTWLSAALTDHETCLDALDEIAALTNLTTISQKLKSAMANSTAYTSNSLAIVAKILSKISDLGINQNHQRRRRLLNDNSSPSWVGPGVRRLLEDDFPQLTPNITVAADGTGDVKTVNEAVARVPAKKDTYFLIYVKAGTYVENVLLDKNIWNVFMYGDGMDKTIISGSRSNGAGVRTFKSATLGVAGRGFIMKDIGIINTAGPNMGQAVAFRSDSDLSAYYRCSFEGYQDTLYPHAYRQFYRECDITGTVDFIFGDASAVFQNCTIRPRQPLHGQSNTITAQGRTSSDQSSGFSIQRCTISANGNVTAPTYLGRPWKKLSTTVVMESEIGSIVEPDGWLSWQGSSGMFYGEYKNSGPGSSLGKRVDWAGMYKPVMTDAEAAQFTVASFIHGNEWLPSTGVPFSPY